MTNPSPNPYARRMYFLLIGLIVIVACFSAGFYAGGGRQLSTASADSTAICALGPDASTTVSADFAPFWKVWQTLSDKYVPTKPGKLDEKVTDQEKVWGATQGLASSLGDPYTVFFPPTQKKLFDSEVSGNFEGVGMEIGIRDGVLTVIAPIKDSPSMKAGIKSGDKILKINATSTADLSVDEAVDMIRGPKGTQVDLTILRNDAATASSTKNQPFDIKITRDVINLPTLDSELRKDGVFVIHLYEFTDKSPDLFRNALDAFSKTNSDKLIIDLRGNPGGYLDAAVDMASWFLPADKVVVRESSGHGVPDIVHQSIGYNVFNSNLKVVVLVDGGSASASEILAGALSENGVAKVIGTQSFGKGSVQEVVPITDDTELKVTVARWLTPKGNSISGNGITPDIIVKPGADDVVGTPKDAQLDRAVQYLLNGK